MTLKYKMSGRWSTVTSIVVIIISPGIEPGVEKNESMVLTLDILKLIYVHKNM